MKYSQLKVFILMAFFFTSCGGQKKSDLSQELIRIESKDTVTYSGADEQTSHTSYEYTDSSGKQVVIYNSYPKGGSRYTDPKGNVYSYAVFWTRIRNETDHPLEVNIDFPETSYELSNFPGKYFKILVPSDTMTPDKIPLFNYGLTDIDTFLDNNTHKRSAVNRTIPSKESGGFYFLMLILTEHAAGMTRNELSLKGKDLYYKISRFSSTKPLTLIDEIEIPCGSINLKKLILRNKKKGHL